MLPRRRPKNRSIVVALYANAILLAIILVAVLARGGGRSPFESAAFGQQVPQPIAGGAGFFLMPAQFASNAWGCYVMDVDAQTLVAYRYDPAANAGAGALRLSAARSFVYDRQLRKYNTPTPTPDEVRQIVEAERDQSLRPDDATTKPTIPQQ